MKRVQYHRYGGPEVLSVEEFALAAPRRGQIRVRIRAAAANPSPSRTKLGDPATLTVRSASHLVPMVSIGVPRATGFGLKALVGLRIGDGYLSSSTPNRRSMQLCKAK
jgi:hypothetical protein